MKCEISSLTGLGNRPIFVGWKEVPRGPQAKPTKVPRDPNRRGADAESDNPDTWGTLKASRKLAEIITRKGNGGVGVMFTDLGDGTYLSGIDLDSCYDSKTGATASHAAEIIERFAGAYVEVSPSGKGLKLYFRVKAEHQPLLRKAMGRTQDGKERHGKTWNKGEKKEIALHLSNRFFAMTGIGFGQDPDVCRVVGANDDLGVIGLAPLLWLIHVAGPDYKSGKPKDRDGSGSGALFRLARWIKAAGGTREDFEEAIDDDADAAAHVATNGERAVDRAWERNPEAPEQSDSIAARLNARFAVVRHAGRTLIAEFKPDGNIDLGNVDDLHTLFANDLVPTPDEKRLEPASKTWVRDPNRRTYPEGIVFNPSEHAQDGALNLWTGWAIEPERGAACDRILAHIRDVICGGVADHYAYVIGWLADMVQNAGRKPGVALVLKGGKGAGKDTLAEIVTRIVGKRHTAHIDKPDLLTARFNAHFATALLGHVEEAYWAGSPDKKGILQALITSPTMTLERKGIDAVVIDSYVRLLMTTNEDWAVPASADERRYAVFDVSGDRIGDRPYFDALYTEIENGGAAGFLAHLLSVDLSAFAVRDVPQTFALRDQKLASLRGLDRWILELLHDGDLGEPGEWHSGAVSIERDHLRKQYELFCRENRNQGDPINSTHFGRKLHDTFPDMESARPRIDRKPGPRVYILPSLAKCREAFERHMKTTIGWEDGQ